MTPAIASTAETKSRLDVFQKLALITTGLTYALVAVGGLVRATGSGLGCPDWPKCFGAWVPPTHVSELPPQFDPALFSVVNTWIEYINRLFGVLVGLFIVATAVVAIAKYRHAPRILWPTVIAMFLTAFEGWLGSVVVKLELAGWIVTVHLVVALIIVSLLLYATVCAFFEGGRPLDGLPAYRKRLGFRAGIVTAIALVQISLGAMVRGSIDDVSGVYTELVRSEWLETVGWIDIAHRQLAVVAFVGTLFLLYAVRQARLVARPLFYAALASAAIAGLQIVTGLVLAYAALPPPAQVIHLVLGSLLLGALTVFILIAYRLPASAGEREAFAG